MGTTLAAPIIPLWFSLRRAVNRPGAWTRPSKGREEERKRESERKERAKMGTDGFLASVPDFRTVALYHSLLTTHHSQPLLSSHYGSRSEKPSTVPEHGPVLRKGKERCAAKMGTDRFLWSVPDFRITNNQQPTTAPVIPHWFSLRRAVHRPPSQSMDPSLERARRGEKERE